MFLSANDPAISKWTTADNSVTILVDSRSLYTSVVAVDLSGNVYFADTSAIKKWIAADNTVTNLIDALSLQPEGVAVDGSGNVYFNDVRTYTNYTIKKWTAADNMVTNLVSSGLNFPKGVAVDGTGNVYFADSDNNAIKELPRAFVDPTTITEDATAGSDVLPVIFPVTQNQAALFAVVSDADWLTLSRVTNGVIRFSFTANFATPRTGHITLLGHTIAITQAAAVYFLDVTNLLEGPAAGSDSVTFSANASWSASTSDSWLHLSAENQDPVSSTNLVFSFDANNGTPRTGTLTIAGFTVTVTQAGAAYVAAGPVTLVSSGLTNPPGVAVDGYGNVYISDNGSDAIKKWTAAYNTVSTLVSLSLYAQPYGVAVDDFGNVYFNVSGEIEKWMPANNSVTNLFWAGSYRDLAVDGAGNVYTADANNNAIKKWTASSATLTTLVSSGLKQPCGVAVDGAGNVYIADTGNNAIKKWVASNGEVTNLVSSGLNGPNGVAVDRAGNVYFADTENNAVKKWSVASATMTTLVSLYYPSEVAVDGKGNVYIGDAHGAINVIPRAFVDSTGKAEAPGAGSDVLPVILPATQSLAGPFAPTSDAAWLTISGVTNGVVSFVFTANTSASPRTGNLTVLGQTIAITQSKSVPVTPPVLTGGKILAGGTFQMSFTAPGGLSFAVLSTTNLALSLEKWTVVGAASETPPASGQYQFTDLSTTSSVSRFYRVSTP